MSARHWAAPMALLLVATSEASGAQTYSYVATLGEAGVAGTDNAHFARPRVGAVDLARGRLLIADTGNDRVQIYDTATLAYIGTIGAGALSGPADVAFDATAQRILIADTGHDRIALYDAASLAPIGAMGAPGTDPHSLKAPCAVTPGAARKIYVADCGHHRIAIFDGKHLARTGTIDVDGVDLLDDPVRDRLWIADPAHSEIKLYDTRHLKPLGRLGGPEQRPWAPAALAYDPPGFVVIADGFPNDRVQIFDAGSAAFVATLGQITGAPATDSLSFSPGSVSVDPAHGQVFIGDPDNERVEVYAAVPAIDLLANTVEGDGILHMKLGTTAAFAIASVNAGATGRLTALLDTGDTALPLDATICETGKGGACLAPPAALVTLLDETGATPTFSVFVTAHGAIPLVPDRNSLFVRFVDSAGKPRGMVSVAVEAK